VIWFTEELTKLRVENRKMAYAYEKLVARGTWFISAGVVTGFALGCGVCFLILDSFMS
jgi:hypothetical protein